MGVHAMARAHKHLGERASARESSTRARSWARELSSSKDPSLGKDLVPQQVVAEPHGDRRGQCHPELFKIINFTLFFGIFSLYFPILIPSSATISEDLLWAEIYHMQFPCVQL